MGEGEKGEKDDAKVLGLRTRRMHHQLIRKDGCGEVVGEEQVCSLGKGEFEMHVRHSSVTQNRQSDTQLWVWKRGLN